MKKGDLLLEPDLEQIKAEGFDIITPVVICNTDDFAEVAMAEARDVEVGDTIINLKK